MYYIKREKPIHCNWRYGDCGFRFKKMESLIDLWVLDLWGWISLIENGKRHFGVIDFI